LNIKFFYDQIEYRIHRTAEIKKFVGKVITEENKTPGDLLFIFTSDEIVRNINRKFLEHDYNTDVISFDYSSGKIVNGEIYISIDSVKRNALKYSVTISEELLRVIIHGVLHLCGYNDGNKNDRDFMFERQENRLKEFRKEI
jgi:probable rRNA maturation factor